MIILSPGANGKVTPEDVDRAEEDIAAARLFCASLRFLLKQYVMPWKWLEAWQDGGV